MTASAKISRNEHRLAPESKCPVIFISQITRNMSNNYCIGCVVAEENTQVFGKVMCEIVIEKAAVVHNFIAAYVFDEVIIGVDMKGYDLYKYRSAT